MQALSPSRRRESQRETCDDHTEGHYRAKVEVAQNIEPALVCLGVFTRIVGRPTKRLVFVIAPVNIVREDDPGIRLEDRLLRREDDAHTDDEEPQGTKPNPEPPG